MINVNRIRLKMRLEIKSYEQKYFNELCLVMDRARKQELQSEDLEEVFLPLPEDLQDASVRKIPVPDP